MHRLLLLISLAHLLARTAHGYSACQQQFLDAIAASGKNASFKMVDFIDEDTPQSDCRIQLCQGPYSECNPDNGGGTRQDLFLVFSDEFEKPERRFDVKSNDKRWTAQDMYYFPTQDIEVYKPEQVITWNGRAVITMERAKRPEAAFTLQPDGEKWNVAKNFKSGMVNSWNKWCFTGGYMEMKLKMPGKPNVPGFWPAFWAMGNLGRAGYMPSTGGFWPYSYNHCGDGTSKANSIPVSLVPPQKISACPQNVTDPNFVNVTNYDFAPGVARNAPEFDVFEGIVTRKGPEVSQTLQMAPLLPLGVSWRDTTGGLFYPGGKSHLATEPNSWQGSLQRPGNEYQDSISAHSFLNSSFYESFHTFGVDWAPGEYLRWYVDGVFAYEINPNALVPQSGEMNGRMYSIGPRQLPVEPMYMIFNLGMSESFGEVDIENLPFPSYMMIEYIRVYQRPSSINVGCSPPDYPTEKWIACHKDKYMVHKADEVLIPQTCSAASRAWTRTSLLLAAVLTVVVYRPSL